MARLNAVLNSLIDSFDRYQQRHKVAGLPYAVFKKYSEDQTGRWAALFTYYGFLALFPLLLVLTTAIKLLIHNNPKLSSQVVRGAITYFPVLGHDLQQDIHGITKTGATLIIGLLLTLFGARGVADVLRSSIDHIWQVPRGKRSGFPGSIVRSVGIIVIGGIGLLIAPLAADYTLVFGHSFIFRIFSIIVTLIVLFGVLVLIMKMSLSVHMPLRNIWVGAAIAAVSLEVLQILGGYIVSRELRNLDTLYGTFAIVLGLLYWIYLQAQVLFYIFEFDSVRVLKLWPRSVRHPLTPADHRAFNLYINRAKFHDDDENKPIDN
jgi:YihY family inner membrane protein